jgi:hypothetical protein
MQSALKLTGDQITILETSHSSVKTALDNLRDSYVDGTSGISAEDFRLSVISIVQNGILEREQVFTELQQEIIDIHRALVLRFMRHTRWEEPKPLLYNIADKKALLKSVKLVFALLDD